MKKNDLTKEQLDKIKEVSQKYINRYSILFQQIEDYKALLDDISTKLSDTIKDVENIREEEEAMYEEISVEYNIELNEIRDLILDIFNYKETIN